MDIFAPVFGDSISLSPINKIFLLGGKTNFLVSVIMGPKLFIVFYLTPQLALKRKLVHPAVQIYFQYLHNRFSVLTGILNFL